MRPSRPNGTNGPEPAVFELRSSGRDAARPPAEKRDPERDCLLLRHNAEWFCRLRWWVVGLLTLSGLASLFPATTRWFGGVWAPVWMLGSAALLAIANISYLVLLKRRVGTHAVAWALGLIWSQILVDLVVLTIVVQHVGCRGTYAPFMYLFHIILACIFLPRIQSLIVVVVAAALYISCLMLEVTGVLSPHSLFGLGPVSSVTNMTDSIWIWQLGWLLAIWGVIWYLASRLATALRQRDDELVAAHRQLVASCDERSRHMLQTTHQLKSPFAAIDANAQLLMGGYCGTLNEQSRAVVAKISNRCRVLAQQIQDMIQLANLRSAAQAAPAQHAVNLTRLVQASIARVEPTAAARGIRVENACGSVQVRAAEDHVKMLVDNLLSNAVNYSFDNGIVQVECHPDETFVCLVVRDHGIGIPAAKVAQVFDDYFRTKEAALHNKSSTGLGLAIVRDVVQRMGVNLKLESRPGWGTRFTVWLQRDGED